MVQLLPQLQDNFASLLQTKGQSINVGIMVVNHKERECYWDHWTNFVMPFHNMDPMLSIVPIIHQIELLTAFAEHIHKHNCGQGQQVRAGTIQVTVCAIGKTFELDGLMNPLYHTKGRYWLPLEHQIEGYHCQDPLAQCKLAIPISLIEYLVKLVASSSSSKVQATCNMCTAALYFLLHVGKYTSH